MKVKMFDYTTYVVGRVQIYECLELVGHSKDGFPQAVGMDTIWSRKKHKVKALRTMKAGVVYHLIG